MLSFQFEATNHEQTHVNALREIIGYQTHLNRSKHQKYQCANGKVDNDGGITHVSPAPVKDNISCNDVVSVADDILQCDPKII